MRTSACSLQWVGCVLIIMIPQRIIYSNAVHVNINVEVGVDMTVPLCTCEKMSLQLFMWEY